MSQYKIYTKTGDSGSSSLFNGERRQKNDLVFAALGDVDELNGFIGVARSHMPEDGDEGALAGMDEQLAEIQSRLLDVGSAVATPLDASSSRKIGATSFDPAATGRLEEWIDDMDVHLPPLTNFVLPSGGKVSAQLHVARAVCRRAERAIWALGAGSVDSTVQIYVNRLSDYLFTAARMACLKLGGTETVYKKAR